MAGTRRTGRDPRRGPALHLRRGRRVPQRGGGPGARRGRHRRLEERTEGWIAALQLAALSLQGREDVGGFIARFAGDDRYIVDYLVEEVLRHQPDRGSRIPAAVTRFSTGSPGRCVTPSPAATTVARCSIALERANLFIVALDDRREWYRYHHLFADVLRARLLAEQPDQVPLLHQRASGGTSATI